MDIVQMGVVEARFADIIWQNEPVSSSQLIKLSEQKLGWKKSTTFTVLKRLCDKGIFVNNNGVVTSLISKEAYDEVQSRRFVEEAFNGSLPGFLAAFTSKRCLNDEEIECLKKLIREHKEE